MPLTQINTKEAKACGLEAKQLKSKQWAAINISQIVLSQQPFSRVH